MYQSKKNDNRNRGITNALRPWGIASATALVIGTLCQNASAQFYAQSNLVSDVPGTAAFTDTNLVGAWGIIHSSTSPWWVNTTASGLSLLFNGMGQPLPLVVAVPPTNPATATGIAFNGGPGFQVESSLPAAFIFATLNGTISGWNPKQSDPQLAVLKVDNAGVAQYSGVALAERNGQDLLYAANFGQRRIDVFDSSFNPVMLPSGAFIDANVPDNLSVFNVLNVNGVLVVTYAPTNALPGPNEAGQGFVDIFDANGMLLLTLEGGPWMNSPWGVAMAPTDFGKFSGRLLIGMFGSGQIAAFDTKHGHFRGLLKGSDAKPITIGKGLWGLGFGNGSGAGPVNQLYFAEDFVSAGQFHGLFAMLTPIAEEQGDGGSQDGGDGGHDEGNGDR